MKKLNPTKDLLMLYTFLLLCLPGAAAVWVHGFTALMVIVFSVGVAIVAHTLPIYSIDKEEIRHPFSSMVTGMIVALTYTFTTTATTQAVTQVLDASIISAIISWEAELLKKIQGFFSRKYVNPVAAAKLLTLTIIPFRGSVEYTLPFLPIRTSQEFFFFASDHLLYNLGNESDFFTAMSRHYGSNPIKTLVLLNSHAWIGATSCIVALVSFLVLVILFRGYVKWRIPLIYLSTMTILAAAYWLVNGEGEYVPLELRVSFHVFTGSVFFLALFMATDPPTTPVTHLGQGIFGIGLGMLTFCFQLLLNFFGGAVLALVIMNITVPLLDRVGVSMINRPTPEKMSREDKKLAIAAGKRETNCIQCGRCVEVCPIGLNPVFIKEAIEKGDLKKARRLYVMDCPTCMDCANVCPCGIPLGAVLFPTKFSELRKIADQERMKRVTSVHNKMWEKWFGKNSD